MTCNICCDEYNKTTRSKVSCFACDFEVCRTCCETYILSETMPKCMKPECGKEWSRNFLRKNFTQVFINKKYREHLEDVLFDKEKAMLPATQIILENKKRRGRYMERIRQINKEIDRLSRVKIELSRRMELNVDEDYDLYANRTPQVVKEKEEKARFVRQCPSNGCRGYLSSQWKCGLCEQWTCPECHEMKGPNRDCEHTCDPNNLATAKMLMKDSKPCPKCQSLIFKISGCNQMWCTQCHTAFDWATGKLEKNIHNPHFFEWQRKQAGNIPDGGNRNIENDCDRQQLSQQTVILLNQKIGKHMNISNPLYHYHRSVEIIIPQEYARLFELIRYVIELQNYTIRKFNIEYFEYNQSLRLLYLEGSIDEATFKSNVQKTDKKMRKNQEISQVIQFACTATSNVIYRLIDNMNDERVNPLTYIGNYFNELRELASHCNELFREISLTYGCVQYRLNDMFQLVSLKRATNIKTASKKTEDDESDDSDAEPEVPEKEPPQK